MFTTTSRLTRWQYPLKFVRTRLPNRCKKFAVDFPVLAIALWKFSAAKFLFAGNLLAIHKTIIQLNASNELLQNISQQGIC